MAGKTVKPKPGDLVSLVWRDIISYNSWVDNGDLDKQVADLKDEMLCRAVGWVHSIDKDDVCVNAIDSVDGKHMIMVIPRGCIKTMKILEKVK